MLFAQWTAEEVQQVIAAVGAVFTTILTIVITVTQFLQRNKLKRIEQKTDEQSEVLQKQDDILQSHGTVLDLQTRKIDSIETGVKQVVDKQG